MSSNNTPNRIAEWFIAAGCIAGLAILIFGILIPATINTFVVPLIQKIW